MQKIIYLSKIEAPKNEKKKEQLRLQKSTSRKTIPRKAKCLHYEQLLQESNSFILFSYFFFYKTNPKPGHYSIEKESVQGGEGKRQEKQTTRKGQPGDELWQPNQVEIFEIEPQSSIYFPGMAPMSINIKCLDHEEVSENIQQPAKESEAHTSVFCTSRLRLSMRSLLS